jgi:hypothetical protein
LILLFLLLRLREATVSLNKSVANGHFLALGTGAPPFLLAGRGGEDKERCDTFPWDSEASGRPWQRGEVAVFLGGPCFQKWPLPSGVGGALCAAIMEATGLGLPSSSMLSKCRHGGGRSSLACVSSSYSGDRRRVGLSPALLKVQILEIPSFARDEAISG